MKKRILLTTFLIGFTTFLFAQSNLKVIEYKILKFENDKKTELVVPKGQTWKIESMIARKETKIEFVVDDDMYILYYIHHKGVFDELIPFYLPENTKFSLKPIDDKIALSIAVLKIE
jgi:hypothetical protein